MVKGNDVMIRKVLYINNADETNFKGKIIFLFNYDKLNKKKDTYVISTINEFYDIIIKNKEIFNYEYIIIFETQQNDFIDEITECFNLATFLKFYYCSLNRLTKKMNDYNMNLLNCNYNSSYIDTIMSEFVRMNQSGKFIRGTLVNIGFSLFDTKGIENSDDLAIAFEIFQTSILIHDDIIDHATLRRNQNTIHQNLILYWEKMGIRKSQLSVNTSNSLAICAGDIGMYLANQKIIDSYFDSSRLNYITQYFNKVVLKTIFGEVIDVALPFEENSLLNNSLDLNENIIEIYRLKTAWYTLIGPICLGAILAGCSENQIEQLEKFAENLGIAFQIKDDILGIYGDKSLGKNIGSDISEFKQTLLYSYTKNNKEYFDKLIKYYGQLNLTEEKLKIVQDIFKDSGALAFSEKKINEYFDQAITQLNAMTYLNISQKNILLGFIRYLKLRHN